MKGTVEKLYDCTKCLCVYLNEGFPKESREASIENIDGLLMERERLIEQLPPTYSNEEMIIGREMLRYDGLIQGKLTQMFEEVKGDIGQIHRQKVTNDRYVHPYRNSTADGMFLDKRK